MSYVFDDGCCPHGALHVCPAERSAGAAPLDVERLAETLRSSVSFPSFRYKPELPFANSPQGIHQSEQVAKTIAAEYARLAEGTDR